MIICAVPKSIKDAYAAGHWKDIASFKLLLNDLDLKYKIIYLDHNKFDKLFDHCGPDVTDLVIYYSFWPNLLKDIQKKTPWIRLHIRTVNAEALQYWHRADIKFRPTYHDMRAFYGTLRSLWMDTLCRWRVNTMLGISDWDNRNYWTRLPGRSKVKHIPYISPWPYIRPQVKPLHWIKREPSIICMAGQRDRIGKTMIQGFDLFVKAFCEYGPSESWQFLVTSGVKGNEKTDCISRQVTVLGPLDEPWDLLCKTRVVTVLTPLGFGIKTTVIDGLAAGCHVLVHPVLARRFPESVRKQCILYNPDKTVEIEDIKLRITKPPQLNNLNDSLRLQAVQELRQTLL